MGFRQIFASSIGDVDTYARDVVGSLRFENDKWYRYVAILNETATVAGVAGDPVAYNAGGASSEGDDVVCVIDLSDADTVPVCAGFLTGSVAGVHSPATTYYTWVQLTGVVTVPTAITSGVVGRPVYLTTTDKTLAISVEADSAAAYKANVGVEITATAANNKIIADVPLCG